MFRFAYPVILSLIPLLLVGMIFAYRRNQKRLPALTFSNIGLADQHEGMDWKLKLRWLLPVLLVLAGVCLIVALARPQLGQQIITREADGVSIVFVLDISRSMSAQDTLTISRLDHAKNFIQAMIEKRPNDAFGLVVFASNAFQLAAPTLRHDLIIDQLQEVEIAANKGLIDGSAIGNGISSGANLLKTSNAKSKLIILLTDGANNIQKGIAQVDPLSAASAVATLDLRLYSVGIGQRDETSDLDESLLVAMADAGNGQYYYGVSEADFQAIVNEINQQEGSTQVDQRLIAWQDQVDGWLIGALLLLVVERLLSLSFFLSLP
ncbi:hypothetical protein MASR2M15_16520 [Anaerolineales bacterium]